MIVCPNCNHQNPDGAVQCEACYTPLPEMMACPSCGAEIQSDASFCGQCGANLQVAAVGASAPTGSPPTPPATPELTPPDPLIPPDPIAVPTPDLGMSSPDPVAPAAASNPPEAMPDPGTPPPPLPMQSPAPAAPGSTQLQLTTATLLHVQTNTNVELPANLALVHIGKPNDRIPPDIDVSGFPDSEIVSRIHADVRVEGGIYYIEDVGSSNGTYVNNLPLQVGNRHRLRPGDRIALGKGDKVSFIFQQS